jgi:hypothetical protein
MILFFVKEANIVILRFLRKQVRNMKNNLIAILLILTGFQVSGYSPGPPEKNKKYPSFYRENIVVDGNAREWPANSFLTDKEAMMVYSAANDSGNFYICVKIKDEVQQMRVMRSGMDIWINLNGKKKKETGIHFPLAQTLPPSEHRNLNTNGRPDPKKMRMMFLLQVKEMELQGFRTEYNGAVNNKANKSGIVVVINWDSLNTMVYEARIPFRTLNADISTLDHVSIGMIMKALSKPKPEEEQSHQDNGGIMNSPENGTGMGDRQHSGGMHQGEPFGAGDTHRLYEDVDAWMELGIARK